jgi:hypothetical protein
MTIRSARGDTSVHDFTFASAIFRIIKEVSVLGEASGRQVTASSGKVEIASMGQPVESSFNKVVSISQLLGVHCKKKFAIFLTPAGMSLTKTFPGRE